MPIAWNKNVSVSSRSLHSLPVGGGGILLFCSLFAVVVVVTHTTRVCSNVWSADGWQFMGEDGLCTLYTYLTFVRLEVDFFVCVCGRQARYVDEMILLLVEQTESAFFACANIIIFARKANASHPHWHPSVVGWTLCKNTLRQPPCILPFKHWICLWICRLVDRECSSLIP